MNDSATSCTQEDPRGLERGQHLTDRKVGLTRVVQCCGHPKQRGAFTLEVPYPNDHRITI
jgi:hypothetical protein